MRQIKRGQDKQSAERLEKEAFRQRKRLFERPEFVEQKIQRNGQKQVDNRRDHLGHIPVMHQHEKKPGSQQEGAPVGNEYLNRCV